MIKIKILKIKNNYKFNNKIILLIICGCMIAKKTLGDGYPFSHFDDAGCIGPDRPVRGKRIGLLPF